MNISTSITASLLQEHALRYPALAIDDVFKFLFQSAFGCEHMLQSPERATAYIEAELSRIGTPIVSPHDVERLDGNFSRVHLSYLARGLSPATLGMLFYLSAEPQENALDALLAKLDVAYAMTEQGKLPFSPTEFAQRRDEWRRVGFCAIHHSNAFREAYAPAYRVIRQDLVELLPLFTEIDCSNDPLSCIKRLGATGQAKLLSLLQKVYPSLIP